MLRFVNFLLAPLVLLHLALGAFLGKTLLYFLVRDVCVRFPNDPEVMAYLEAKRRR